MWRSLGGARLRLRLPRATFSSSAAPATAAATAAAEHDGGAWPHVVTPALVHELLTNGYVVVRGAFAAAHARDLQREMDELRAAGHFYANATHILLPGAPQPALLHKRHILETELALESTRSRAPALRRFFDEQLVFAPLARALPPWLALHGAMVKLQYNEGGGGCFPLHFDTYGDDGKCVTAVLYLNEQWADGDGGEIVLYPFPAAEPVVVAPRLGDMVLFSSQQMLHRVLPSRRPRHCLTTWIYQGTPDAAARAAFYRDSATTTTSGPTRSTRRPPPLPDSEPDAFAVMMEKVLSSPFRRHLQKLLYAAEWTQSLHEAHEPTAAFAQYMATHAHELRVIEHATEQMLRNFRAKDPTQPSTLPATYAELTARLLGTATLADGREAAASIRSIPWF
ncbi:hypothetical protein PybrP1_009004 [[Pythium] brassicae (nom. inval.)]|nr:hypothetical protein PybrP1_009004 [[Pythium] brassicae (nom. inval.)]